MNFRNHAKIALAIVALFTLQTTFACATANGSLNISGAVSGNVDGSVNIGPITISTSSAVYQRTVPTFSSGANTVTIPTGATVCIIILPSGNTQTVTLKGVTGDTGIPLNKTGTNILQVDSGTSTFCLTAGGTINGTVLIFL